MDTKPVRKRLDRLVSEASCNDDDVNWMVRTMYQMCETIEHRLSGPKIRKLKRRGFDGLTMLKIVLVGMIVVMAIWLIGPEVEKLAAVVP